MSIVKGVVEAKSNKFDKFSILVNGDWYSSKYEIRAEKGDEVEFDNGEKKYVRKLRVTNKGGGASTGSGGSQPSRIPGFPVGVDTKDRSIVRQNSLNHASILVSRMLGEIEYDSWEEREAITKKFANLVVDTARIFEDYSAGDSDAEEAKQMLEE